MRDTQPVRVCFGPFELDLKAGELRRGELRIVLREQPFQILQMLVERAGEIVTREEIQKELWSDDTVVEFDHSINAAIRNLRRALNDSANEPRYVETVARRGYRLKVLVERVENPPEPTSLTGKQVSHYRVLEVIGGGGMGVVYRAEDLKLGRAVALKFLPVEVGNDSRALERFQREARAASSLDHPNICAVHELEEYEGSPFIVMQLLEGQTLRDWLVSATADEKSEALQQLLSIAIQVAEGLQTAHEKGIIHRDIKPANIFLTNKGVAKILDFGLAELIEASEEVYSEAAKNVSDKSGSFTVAEELEPPTTFGEAAATADFLDDGEVATASLPAGDGCTAAIANTGDGGTGLHLTRTGFAFGTAAYMSPEQIRGEKLDARTDLFSFGLVLYEMFTGQRAFSGKTAAVVHKAILHQPLIPVHDLNPELPPGLETIINKALEKDRELRYESAAQMSASLKVLHHGKESVTQKPKRYARVLLLWGAALAFVLVALGLGLRRFKVQQTAPRKMVSERQLTHNPWENEVINAAISPDGKYVAYTDSKGLHLSVIETGEFHDVPLPEELRTHVWEVTWFPDGQKLIFTTEPGAFETSAIWTISVFGGAPHQLASGGSWPGPVVSPQGSWIAFVGEHDREIWVMGANGANLHRILTGENERYMALAWSPTGQRLAYVRGAGSQTGGSIETVSLDGGPPSEVISDPQLVNADHPGLVWVRDGRIVFVKREGSVQDGANLWAIMTDPVTGKPSGRAGKITDWDGFFADSPTVSQDANRLTVMKTRHREDIYIGELKDGATHLTSPTRLTVSESVDLPTGWMRDGKSILFTSNRTGRLQVFRQAIEHDTPEPLIVGPDDEEGAELSPDGRWILYWSSARGEGPAVATKRLIRIPTSGGRPEQVLEVQDDDASFDCPVRPGSFCVLTHWDQGQLILYTLDAVQGRGKELTRTKLGSPHYVNWSVSPEGLQVAVVIKDQQPEQLRIVDLRNGTERSLPVPPHWGVWDLSWTADGNALFAAGRWRSKTYFIARIDLDGKTRVLLNRGKDQVIDSPCLSPDGRHLAFSQRTVEAIASLLESF
jgi:serine/threonine protein kinase/Tol biopolymer transport system component